MLKLEPKYNVAVLLAAYNGRAWIEEQIITIRSQIGVSVTIFISLDKSTDGSACFISEIAPTYDLKILPCHGRLGGAAKNFFRLIKDVDFSSFDYVALADQDDIWLPQKLLRGCDELQRTGASGYSSNVIAFWPDGRQKLINKAQKQTKYDHLYESPGPGCTFILRTDDLCALKIFLNEHHEKINQVDLHDWFLYAWCRSSGRTWIIDDVPTMFYRQHGSNQVGANEGMSALVRRLKMLRSGWYKAEIAKLCELCKAHGTVPAFVETPRRLSLLPRAFKLRRRFRDKLAIIVIIILNF